MAKLRVGLLFGGRSVEHEVSIASAASILAALDPSLYDVRLIGVDQEGRWHAGARTIAPGTALGETEVLLPATPRGGELVASDGAPSAVAGQLDVIFPIIHGSGGEDGTLQGLLELADIPYVGSGVLGSAIQMDKDVAKRLLAAAGLPVVPWRVIAGAALHASDRDARALALAEEIGFPVFVKPANSGSNPSSRG